MSSKSSRLIGPSLTAIFFGGSASETKWGSTSYCTFIARPENLGSRRLQYFDCSYACHLLGCAAINAGDARVGVRAAKNLSRKQALGVVVIGVFRAAGNFHGTVNSRNTLAQQRTGCRIGPLVLAHDTLPSGLVAKATARIPL